MKMESLCDDCGAPMGKHRVGGSYHPRPLKPEAEQREEDWSAFAADARTMSRGMALAAALNRRAAAERASIVAMLNEQARLAAVEGNLEAVMALVKARLAIERGDHVASGNS